MDVVVQDWRRTACRHLIRSVRPRLVLLSLITMLVCGVSRATVVTPSGDDEVIEVLPAPSGNRVEERQLRQRLAADPQDAPSAVALARRYLAQAHAQGDPRFAGRAFAALQAWPDPASAPDEVLMALATLQQYLHDFDTSVASLERLVKRRPQHAQAWLTLATVRRVQGRYADSDRACEGLLATGASLYARACQAENDSLRGEYERTRASIAALLATPRLPAETRNWLLTTLAESEARAGLAKQAEIAYRQALEAQPDAYTTMSYADFLLERQRPGDALAQLRGQPRTDAVLLRLAIAGEQSGSPHALSDAAEMKDRMAMANLRPEARTTHARELAMFALWIDKTPSKALNLARENVKHQREPLDLLVLAQAAAASRNPTALREADVLRKSMDLHDKRLDALL